jgi:hypothetical protein
MVGTIRYCRYVLPIRYRKYIHTLDIRYDAEAHKGEVCDVVPYMMLYDV